MSNEIRKVLDDVLKLVEEQHTKPTHEQVQVVLRPPNPIVIRRQKQPKHKFRAGNTNFRPANPEKLEFMVGKIDVTVQSEGMIRLFKQLPFKPFELMFNQLQELSESDSENVVKRALPALVKLSHEYQNVPIQTQAVQELLAIQGE